MAPSAGLKERCGNYLVSVAWWVSEVACRGAGVRGNEEAGSTAFKTLGFNEKREGK